MILVHVHKDGLDAIFAVAVSRAALGQHFIFRLTHRYLVIP